MLKQTSYTLQKLDYRAFKSNEYSLVEIGFLLSYLCRRRFGPNILKQLDNQKK